MAIRLPAALYGQSLPGLAQAVDEASRTAANAADLARQAFQAPQADKPEECPTSSSGIGGRMATACEVHTGELGTADKTQLRYALQDCEVALGELAVQLPHGRCGYVAATHC
jgi:hypothetical protein